MDRLLHYWKVNSKPRILLIFLCSTLHTVGWANAANSQSFTKYPNETREKYCPIMGEIASFVIESRLMSLPLSDSISMFTEVFANVGEMYDETELGKNLSATAKEIAIAAYTIDLPSDGDDLIRVRNEFRSGIEIRCYEGK